MFLLFDFRICSFITPPLTSAYSQNTSDNAEYVPLAGSSLAALSITRNKGDVDSVLASFKARLAERGARGIIGLSRRFRSMDDDGSQALSVAEFKKAVRESSIDLTDQVFLSIATQVL